MGTNLRNTAANKVITEDFNVPLLLQDLDTTAQEFAEAAHRLENEKANVAQSRKYEQNRRDEILMSVTDAERIRNEKVSQTAIDGAVRLALAKDPTLDRLVEDVRQAQSKLGSAQAEFDSMKAEHRSVVAKAGLAQASLMFMGLSKQARSAALAFAREM